MRHRVSWAAELYMVSGDHLRQFVKIYFKISTPGKDEGRTVVLTLTREECAQIERQLANMRENL